MNKQQVLSHCNIVLTHKYNSVVEGSTLTNIVDTFYVDGDPQQSISQTIRHYQLLLEGLWELPFEEDTALSQKPPTSMLRDWTRTW